MRFRTILILLGLAATFPLMLGPGCQPVPVITILSPEEGATTGFCGPHFEATFQNVTEDPPDATVLLNGVAISGDGTVTIGENTVTITGFTLSFAGVLFDACGLPEGSSIFEISITPTTESVNFSVIVERGCNDILELDPTAESGRYLVDPTGSGNLSVEVLCDMTTDGGGWTLIGSQVNNDNARKWNSLEAFTNDSTFGSLDSFQSADFKSPTHKYLGAEDLMVRTEEYAVAYHDLLGGETFGNYVESNWPDSCSTAWVRSGADFAENLTTDQAKLFGFTLRGLDTNCNCFPGCNENTAITFLATYYWNNGLGNASNGQATWSSHDHSFLKKANIVPVTCTGGWPCNANGVYVNNGYECYDTSCKTQRAEVYVR